MERFDHFSKYILKAKCCHLGYRHHVIKKRAISAFIFRNDFKSYPSFPFNGLKGLN